MKNDQANLTYDEFAALLEGHGINEQQMTDYYCEGWSVEEAIEDWAFQKEADAMADWLAEYSNKLQEKNL